MAQFGGSPSMIVLWDFSFYFYRNLPEEIKSTVTKIANDYDVTEETRSFMAISLHRADKEKFELDFHDLERKILYNRGCVKKVIKLLKYMRDEKGGPMAKLWSHLLKVEYVNLFLLHFQNCRLP